MIVALLCARSNAHTLNVPMAALVVHRDGTFTIDANFDLPAYVLNDTPARIGDDAMNAWMDGPDEEIARGLADAKDRLAAGIVVIAGGKEMTGELGGFIGVLEVHAWRESGIKPRLPMMAPAIVRGRLPEGATSIAVRFPEVLGSVLLTVERPGEEPMTQSLDDGRASEALAIHVPKVAVLAPVVATVQSNGDAAIDVRVVAGALAVVVLGLVAAVQLRHRGAARA